MKHAFRKHVFHAGDEIWVNTNQCVVRVGYPKSCHDYYPGNLDKPCYIAERLLTGVPLEYILKEIEVFKLFPNSQPFVNHRVLELASYLRAKQDGFGGNERTIHFDTIMWSPKGYSESGPTYPFKATVIRKRVVKTGTYRPGYRRSSLDYEYDDYYPSTLEDQQTHVILSTTYGDFLEAHCSPVLKETE